MGDPALALQAIDGRFFVRDEGARSLLGREQFADFELAVSADDGVGIDGDVDGELADRGKLIAGAKGSGSDAAQDLIDDLAVGGDAAAGIQRELNFAILRLLVY